MICISQVMPRKPIIRSSEHYYHLTGRSNNREHFYLSPDEVWEVMTSELRKLQNENDLKISAFVLMGNHFHLLALTPKETIDRIMYFFMKKVTYEMHKKTGRINKIFGGRYKGCLIDDPKYLLNVYKYIYRNPVAAGIVKKAEEYPYSTLFYDLNESKPPFTLFDVTPVNIAASKLVKAEWINSTFDTNEVESMKWGLSKTKFQYKKERNQRKAISPAVPI